MTSRFEVDNITALVYFQDDVDLTKRTRFDVTNVVGDQIIAFPNTTDTMVTQSFQQALTNKYLEAPTTFVYGGATADYVNLAIQAGSGGQTMTFPNISQVLVGTTVQQDLTNKHLEAASTQIYGSATTNFVTFDASALSGGQTMALPNTSDTFVMQSYAQALENKSLQLPTTAFYGGATADYVNFAVQSGAGGQTMTFPNISQTLVGTTVQQDLTNKHLEAASTQIYGSATTNFVTFDASALSGGQTMALPNTSDTFVMQSYAQALEHKDLQASTISIYGGATADYVNLAVVPGAGGQTMTFPNISQTLVGTTIAQTLTNKTITGATLSTTQVNDGFFDVNGNELVLFGYTAAAVNELTITNASTGTAPSIAATGTDTNIDLIIDPKGTGKIKLDDIFWPKGTGAAGQVLTTDGTGNLSFGYADVLSVDMLSTTGNTITPISTVATAANTSYLLEINLVAIRSDGVNAVAYKFVSLFRNSGASAAKVNEQKTILEDTGATAADASTSVSGTNILINVRGITATTYKWKCSYKYSTILNTEV